MPEMQHLHQFSSMNGGYGCQLCTYVLTDAQVGILAPNDQDAQGFNQGDLNLILNQVWEEITPSQQGT